MELLTMSKKERQVLETLHRMDRGEVTRSEAGRILGFSSRHVYRVYARWKASGDGALVHRSRGGHSGRGYPLEVRNNVLRLYHAGYSDYGPSLFSEILSEQHGLTIHRETLRRWLLDVGLWKPAEQGRKRSKHRRARPRRRERGALLQLDGSPHDWFEGRNPEWKELTLLVLIDDASGRSMLRFSRSEDTQSVFELLRAYCQRYGLPKAVYTDFGTVYWTDGGTTQYERALRELGIEVIRAYSPQAKGRVERANRTHQDRLVKALRQRGIATIEEANRFLDEEYTAKHNQRFAVKERLADVHRPIDAGSLDRAFAIVEERIVRNDHTIVLATVRWQIEKPGSEDRYLAPSPGAKVEARVYLDGSVHVFAGEQEVRVTRVAERLGTQAEQNDQKQQWLGIPGRTKTKATSRHLIAKRVINISTPQ